MSIEHWQTVCRLVTIVAALVGPFPFFRLFLLVFQFYYLLYIFLDFTVYYIFCCFHHLFRRGKKIRRMETVKVGRVAFEIGVRVSRSQRSDKLA